jgi:hypothetical protein
LGVCGSEKTPLYLHPLFEGTERCFLGGERVEKFIDILTDSVAPLIMTKGGACTKEITTSVNLTFRDKDLDRVS